MFCGIFNEDTMVKWPKMGHKCRLCLEFQ